VANNVLYAPDGNLGTYTGQTLNATTGAALGTFTALYPPAVGTQNAFLTLGGSLSAVSVGSNAVAWTFAGDGALNTSPLLVNQAVIVGSEGGNLYALDAMTGTQLWTINVGSRILASPDGSQLNTPLSGMAAGDGVLIVPLGTGIVCFTLSTNP
jgi:outer membrane protein assembly factor BamB